MRDGGQDVAPHGAVDPSALSSTSHVAGLDVVDVVADGALFDRAHWSIADGERAVSQSELGSSGARPSA